MTYLQILFILLFNYSVKIEASSSLSLPIGGLFNKLTNNNSVDAFKTIVDKKKKVLNGSPIYPQTLDSFSNTIDVCNSEPVVALIDARPTYGICDAVCLICNKLRIPHLSVGWQPPEAKEFTFSYHPPSELISKAFASLIQFLQWDKFTILYEDDDSFVRLQEVINTWPRDRDPILYRKLDPEGDNRETFKHIFKVARISHHVLDCHVEHVERYMRQIVTVENSTQYQSFILSSLDAYSMVQLDTIPDLMANVSTLHLTKADDIRWKDIGMGAEKKITLETALTADALNHLEIAIKAMKENDESNNYDLKTRYGGIPQLCFHETDLEYKPLVWPAGYDLQSAILSTAIDGFTEHVEFDSFGRRTNFNISYSKLNNESQFVYAGYWSSRTEEIVSEIAVSERSTARKSDSVIRVASIKGEPYFSISDENGTVSYYGYAVDLIDEIFKEINREEKTQYKYEFYRVAGDAYGNPIEGSKKWTGLIGEIIDHNAELGICDLTITAERNNVVEFSLPFMSLGISMLFRIQDPEIPDKFSFIKPLHLDVWLYLATSLIMVSFTILLCARMSTGDWVNPHPCNQNPEKLENIWTLYNSFWLTTGAIMTQGCDILPRGATTRWVTGIWWFFALIVTSSYTANMSTFVSSSRRDNEIKNVNELAEQHKITYGTVCNASTYRFFEKSNDSVYSKIWTVMSSARPSVFTSSNQEGKDRVRNSKGFFAFFMESTAIEFYTYRDCDLKMVGNKLDSKEYGIAMPKNSQLKNKVDRAILKLQEHGILENIYRKWWKDSTRNCEEKRKLEDDNGSLQMKNTSGIFIVLGCGGVLGLIVALIDFSIYANKIAVKEKIPFKEAFMSEWKASLNPWGLQKSAVPPRSAPPSLRSSRDKSKARSRSRAASFINLDDVF